MDMGDSLSFFRKLLTHHSVPICLALFLCALALLLRLLFPYSAKQARAVFVNDASLDQAVTAFYRQIAADGDLGKAIAVFAAACDD